MYLLSILFLIFSFNGAFAYTIKDSTKKSTLDRVSAETLDQAEINPEPEQVVTKEKRDFKIKCVFGTALRPKEGEPVLIYGSGCNSYKNFDFSNGNFKSAEIDHADLTGANFFGADLRNALIKETNFKDANFDYADLRGATLYAVDIIGASFKRADLTGAIITTKDLNTAEKPARSIFVCTPAELLQGCKDW